MASKKDNPNVAREVVISAPKLMIAEFRIIGTTPYMQNKFSAKAAQKMREAQEKGSQGRKGTKKEPKDFHACYEAAMHVSREGWHGIPASAFRKAMISACRLVGFKMTLAKLSVFVLADGFDRDEGDPLVRITKGEPKYTERPVRNASGVCDIRARPQWDDGWEAVVRVQYDADQFSLEDVTNLMARVGAQVGIGEGRNDSSNSAGLSIGSFRLGGDEEGTVVMA